MSMKREENELLVRVGPGTPMGDMMRRYWHPVAVLDELPEPDGDPMRVRLLGQNFVVFRNTAGQLGMLDELCMHRLASLALGRVENNGIRCLYHGWKFGVDGALQEAPNMPDARYTERHRANVYPLVEDSGMLWAYIGPKEHQPPFRFFAPHHAQHLTVFRVNQAANYLQAWEGGLDSSHVTMLHTNQARPAWAASVGGTPADRPLYAPLNDATPSFEIEDTSFGYHYAATRRTHHDGEQNIRIVPAILPTGRIIPGPRANFDFFVWETPIDDETTATFLCLYGPEPINRDKVKEMLGLNDPRVWSEECRDLRLSWDNRFVQDRAAMRGADWSGIRGIILEDAAMTVSMGAVVDRSLEHLVPADMAVVRVRRRLREAVDAVRQGKTPPGVLVQDLSSVRAFDAIAAQGTSWKALAECNREAVAA